MPAAPAAPAAPALAVPIRATSARVTAARAWWLVAAALVAVQAWLLVDALGWPEPAHASPALLPPPDQAVPAGPKVPAPAADPVRGARVAAVRAMLVVESPQPGAEVTIDGIPFAVQGGVCRVATAIGHTVRVEVSAPGFLPRTHLVAIAHPFETVVAGLQPAPALAFPPRPEDAALSEAFRRVDEAAQAIRTARADLAALQEVEALMAFAEELLPRLEQLQIELEQLAATLPDAARADLAAYQTERLGGERSAFLEALFQTIERHAMRRVVFEALGPNGVDEPEVDPAEPEVVHFGCGLTHLHEPEPVEVLEGPLVNERSAEPFAGQREPEQPQILVE